MINREDKKDNGYVKINLKIRCKINLKKESKNKERGMEENLLEILREKNVRITKSSNINLTDLVKNVVGSKNPESYIKNKVKADDMIIKNNKTYVTPETCIELLKNSNFKASKEIYNKIQIINNGNISIIDVKNQIFQFEGKQFMSFFTINDGGEWDVWLKGTEVVNYLIYRSNPEKSIKKYVSEGNKCPYDELSKILLPGDLGGNKYINKNTMFINLQGFFELVCHSKQPTAIKIKKWLHNEVMPALVKYGTYTMQPEKLEIVSFYDNAKFSDYDKKSVIYIAYIGIHKNEHIFKYGISRNMFNRECKQHRKRFETFEVVYIGKTDNCIEIEKMLKNELVLRHLNRNIKINDKRQTELFTVTYEFTYQYFIKMTKSLITKHRLPAVEKADQKINDLETTIESYKTSNQVNILKAQYKLSDNYKLKLEIDREIKTRELEINREIEIRKLDLHAKELEIRATESKNKVRIKELELELGMYGKKKKNNNSKE